MTALSTRTDISGTPSNATLQAALAAIYDFIAQRFAFGTSGVAAPTTAELALARNTVGVREPGPQFPNSSTRVAQRISAAAMSTSRQIGSCDNIKWWVSAGAVSAGTISQTTTAISGSTGNGSKAAGVTTTGSAVVSAAISMEGAEAVWYKNKVCSFQVAVDHDVGSSINATLVVSKPTTTLNIFSARTVISTGSAVSVATATGTRLTFNNVSMGDCSKGIELEVQFACNAVTTKNYTVTEWGIEAGTAATPWGMGSIVEELRLCQRLYYAPTPLAANASTHFVHMYNIAAVAGDVVLMPFSFPVKMLRAPTVLVANSGGWNLTNSTTPTSNSSSSQDGLWLICNSVAAGTMDAYPNLNTIAFDASCELI